jgi:hypothetical protein
MAYLAWIASELGSATGFPNGNIILQKPQREEDQECWSGPRAGHPTLHAVTPLCRTAQLPDGQPEVIQCKLLTRTVLGVQPFGVPARRIVCKFRSQENDS